MNALGRLPWALLFLGNRGVQNSLVHVLTPRVFLPEGLESESLLF